MRAKEIIIAGPAIQPSCPIAHARDSTPEPITAVMMWELAVIKFPVRLGRPSSSKNVLHLDSISIAISKEVWNLIGGSLCIYTHTTNRRRSPPLLLRIFARRPFLLPFGIYFRLFACLFHRCRCFKSIGNVLTLQKSDHLFRLDKIHLDTACPNPGFFLKDFVQTTY